MKLIKPSYDYDELIISGEKSLFGPGNAKLPLPPMLMLDRITHMDDNGGEHSKGQLIAELDINPDLWFFECHFKGDPVMPGCLGLDAMWQLVGFWLGWTGSRVIRRKLVLGIADGRMYADDELIYQAKDLRVGLFVPPAEDTNKKEGDA